MTAMTMGLENRNIMLFSIIKALDREGNVGPRRRLNATDFKWANNGWRIAKITAAPFNGIPSGHCMQIIVKANNNNSYLTKLWSHMQQQKGFLLFHGVNDMLPQSGASKNAIWGVAKI